MMCFGCFARRRRRRRHGYVNMRQQASQVSGDYVVWERQRIQARRR
jgi:hypothetical protein